MSNSYTLDLPMDLSEKTSNKLDWTKKILHLITGATDILTICIVAPLIATEARYLGAGKAGPNYTLFVALFTLPTPFFLVYFPWMYEKYNKFKNIGKFCMKSRTNMIFNGFDTFLWLTAGIAITVHSNNAGNCALDPDLTETYGDTYTSAWSTQCNLAKVTSGFVWVTCILWLSTLILTAIDFWKEKSLIQQRLKEHRLNKQQKLEQAEDDLEGYPNDSGRVLQEDPFHDEYQQQQQHYYHHQQQQHEPLFDGTVPMGQYSTASPPPQPPSNFSPMPLPQHMPHPPATYYNDNSLPNNHNVYYNHPQ